MNKVYQIITDNFIAKLEEGVIPWKKGWDAPGSRGCNLISKRPYSGINLFITSMMGYSQPYWATFNQIKSSGARIKKGEKSVPIIFYKTGMKTNDKGKEEAFPILRFYNVWNYEQLEDPPVHLLPTPEENAALDNVTGTVDERCRPILLAYNNRPKIKPGGGRACYSPFDDLIRIPKRRYFSSLHEYWATLFHELAHSTGHSDRLKREGMTIMKSTKEYSFEELVAEMTAAFLCAEAGISNEELDDNAVAYIASWLKVLKNEPTWVIKASQKASRAAEYILGKFYKQQHEKAA